jgi:hypothetical protein
MNNVIAPPVIPRRALPKFLWIVVILLGLLGLVVWGVTGYFRLSPDAGALRTIALESAGGSWHKVIALRCGWMTTGLIRTGLGFIPMEPEARAALMAVRGAEVGVYQLEAGSRNWEHRTMLARADKEMVARGWDRAVTVSKANELVAVYLSSGWFSKQNLKCCVLVLQDRELVVVSARANLGPVLALACEHLERNPERFTVHSPEATLTGVSGLNSFW